MAQEQTSQQQLDIRKYLGIVAQSRFLALGFFLLILSVVSWGSFLMKNVYEAKSLVLMERAQVLTPLLRGMAVDSRSEALLRTIRKNMLSRNIIEKVIKKVDLDAEVENDAQYERLIEGMQKVVSIRVQGNDLFEVSYSGGDPKVVRDVVNALVNTYIEANMGSARGETYKAIDFIQEQIMVYKERLDESDSLLRQFKEKNPGILSINEGALLERIRRLRSQLAESELTLKGHIREKESLDSQLKGEEPLAITLVSRGPGGVSDIERRISEAKTRLNMLLAQYTYRHPEVVRLKSEIKELEKSFESGGRVQEDPLENQEVGINPIYQQIRERLSDAKTNIDLLTSRNTELNRLIEQDEKILKSIPREQEDLTRLTRGREVYQNMYDTLMSRLESARVSKAMEEADKGESFRVMDPAILPVRPVKPNRVRFILLGFALGIAGAIGVPIGLDMLNPTFRDVKTVEEIFEVSVIGVIPEMKLGPEFSKKRTRWIAFSGLSTVYVMGILVVLAREFVFQTTGKLILF